MARVTTETLKTIMFCTSKRIRVPVDVEIDITRRPETPVQGDAATCYHCDPNHPCHRQVLSPTQI